MWGCLVPCLFCHLSIGSTGYLFAPWCLFAPLATIVLDRAEPSVAQPPIQAVVPIEPLLARVKRLQHVLAERDYAPDLIVGIARIGLAVAGLLAKTIRDGDPIPTISLCRVAGSFENNFNSLRLSREAFGSKGRVARKVLIVDEFCSSGRTLTAARQYVEDSIVPDDRKSFRIETAAIYFYDIHSSATPPTFFVERPKVPLIDSGGDEEEP